MKALLPLLLLAAAPAFAAPAACPQLGERLAESLASAKQRVGQEGEVRVVFDVQADGRLQIISLEGLRAYRNPVRIAMHTLDCEAGTPHSYAVDIRFADPAPRTLASGATIKLAQLGPVAMPQSR